MDSLDVRLLSVQNEALLNDLLISTNIPYRNQTKSHI